MKNADYWRRRFEILEDAQNKDATKLLGDIERHFNQAQKTLDDQIYSWYGRFADNNEISLVDARKRLNGKELAEFKWDVNEYIKYGQENALNQRWMKELENASARFHVSRLEALKLQTQQTMEKLFGNQLDAVDNHIKRAYLDSYYHTAYELQKGVGVGWDIAGINEKQLERVMSKPWTLDKETFSDRIWTQKEKLINEVHTQLTQNMILGKGPDAAIRAIANKLNTSKANAGRLVMTESAYFAAEAQKDAFRTLDVEEFEIVGTLDSKNCPLCGSFDGEHMPMAQYEAGVTAPPFHPWCRCCTAPYFDDRDGERFARDPESDEGYYVPADMKFEEWKEKFVDGGDKAGIIDTMMLSSKKAAEIINTQKPIDKEVFERVKESLAKKGIAIHQSEESDKWLISKGAEAVTFSDGTIVMHTNVSASGFFEELIHYGQIKNGRSIAGDIENNILLEIEAKERLIKNRKAYGITDYEIEVLTDGLNYYKIELEKIRKAGD